MKIAIENVCKLCVVVALANSLSIGQAVKKEPSSTNTPETTPHTLTREMRKQQLETLRASTLARTLDSIKKVDEPALRVVARIELLSYLTADKILSDDHRAIATNTAHDALKDLADHTNEIMPSLAEYLFSKLAVWIRAYQPSLIATLETLEKNKLAGKDSGNIRALMDLPAGDSIAAQAIGQELAQGRDMPVIALYLHELIRRNSLEVETLMWTIADVATRGGLSIETLFSVSDFYLRPQTPIILKQRFLTMVVARTQPFNLGRGIALPSAYYLLTNVLPAIQQLIPQLYEQAVNQRLVIYASFNEDQRASEERDKSLSGNPKAVEDLIAEADRSKSKPRRNELLARAAELALESKRFSLCLEAVAKIDLDVPGISHDFWKNWNDQFIRGFVSTAIARNDPAIAEKGVEYASTPIAKVENLIVVMQFWVRAGDNASGHRILRQATKAADATTDYVDKAKAFLLLSITTNDTDIAETIDLLGSGIKALNRVAVPKREDDVRHYQRFAWKLSGVQHQLIRSFKDLSKKSNEDALILIERVEKDESKTFGLLGILYGLRDLSLSPRA